MAEVASEELARYAHSPVHYAVARRDYAALRRIISALPRLAKAGEVRTEADSIAEEQRADAISSVLDRRDVPGRETALHLAVRLGDAIAVQILMTAGADWSLQNEKGWSSLQEAVCAREEAIALIIMRHYQPMAWAKWCRRLPRVIATMHRMRDFYMEFTFHFESSVIPFIGRIAPSDTYRIWKRGSNLRADMTLAGFDGFKIQRSDQSFLFLGEGSADGKLSPGYLCILRHKDKVVMNALDGAGSQPSEAEIAQEVAAMFQTNLYRPGIDVTQAELMPQLTWRRHEKTEMVGIWKAKVYDMHHVLVSVKSRRVPGAMSDEEFFGTSEVGRENGYLEEDYTELLTEEEKHELETVLKTDGAEVNDDHSANEKLRPGSQNYITGKMEKEEELRLSSVSRLDCNGGTEFILSSKEEKKGWFSWSRRSFKQENGKKNLPRRSSVHTDEKVSDLLGESPNQIGRKGPRLERGRRSVGSRPSDFRADDGFPFKKEHDGRKSVYKEGNRRRRVTPSNDGNDESEYKKGLRPVLWLTDTFPLETEELLPLLDILANKVKAVRRLRELLTTKLPAGTFPVKVAIPVVPTIRVVVTFTKFEESRSGKEFRNPPLGGERSEDGGVAQQSSNSWFSWRKWPASKATGIQGPKQGHLEDLTDPFTIPSDYVWTSMDSRNWMGKDKASKGKKGKLTPDGVQNEGRK